MSRLANAFAAAARERRPALIAYVTAGDPAFGDTGALICALVEAGADIVEVGVPYSDPLADGPTIQRSGQRALSRGTSVADVFETVAAVRRRGVQAPIMLLAYYNCVFRRGEDAFVRAAASAGADGLIVPDLPPEEAGPLRDHAAAVNLHLVPLAAPTSTDARLRLVGQVASGFVYCVSVTGVTGARDRLPSTLPAFVNRVRRHMNDRVPVAVGFGIADADQARFVGRHADGVIVGSALIQRMERCDTPNDAVSHGAAFIAELRRALEGARAAAG